MSAGCLDGDTTIPSPVLSIGIGPAAAVSRGHESYVKKRSSTIQSVDDIHSDIKEAKKRDVLRCGAK